MRMFALAVVLPLLVACGAAPAPSATVAQKRYLALGDSYTIGESVASTDRWPVQLTAALRHSGMPVADPEIIARTGWTTDELSTAMDDARPRGRYDLVTLLIGVNNQYRGRPADEYRLQFRQLLKRAVALAGGTAAHVIVVSIPDWGATPFAEGSDRAKIGREIDAFNAISLEETAATGGVYADITPVSRRVRTDAALAAPDGLHPSAKMYSQWVVVIQPLAVKILSGR